MDRKPWTQEDEMVMLGKINDDLRREIAELRRFINQRAELPEGLTQEERIDWMNSPCNNRNHRGLMGLVRTILKREPVWPSRTAQDIAFLAMVIDREMVYKP